MSFVEICNTSGNFNIDAYFGLQFCVMMPKVLRDIIETFLRRFKLVFDYQYDTSWKLHEMTTRSSFNLNGPFGVLLEFENMHPTNKTRIYFRLSNDKNNFDDDFQTMVCGLNMNALIAWKFDSNKADAFKHIDDAIRQVGDKFTIEFGITSFANVFVRLYVESGIGKHTCNKKYEIEFTDTDLLCQKGPLYMKCEYISSLKLIKGSLLAPSKFPPNQQHF